MFKNLRIGTRLAVGFGAVLVLTATAIGTGLYEIATVAAQNQRLLSEPLFKERLTSDWYRVIDSGSRRTLAMAVSNDPVLELTFRPDVKESTALASRFLEQLTAIATSPEERKCLDNISSARKVYVSLRNEITDLRRANRIDDAAAFAERLKPAIAGYLGALQAMLDLERSVIDRQAGEIRTEVSRSLVVLGSIGATVLLIGIAFCIFIAKGITQPIVEAISVARRVASGDVGNEVIVDRADELGVLQQSLNDMSGQLRRMIFAIRQSATVIAGATQEIARGNLDLSTRTEGQSNSIRQTARHVEVLSGVVRDNEQSSAHALDVVGSTANSAREGEAIVGEVSGTMQAITSSSKRINDIIGVIDGIAAQTNILALNAGVEAARAGDQGRGFAVVAAEVRLLAQRSASAAQEVRLLIAESTIAIDSGAKKVEQASSAMKLILESVHQVERFVGLIEAASRRQAAGIQQVNEAVSDLDEATRRNAALVKRSANAAQALQDQATGLVELIGAFSIGSVAN